MESLYQHGGLKIKIVKLFPKYSQTSICRHCKRHIGPSDTLDKHRLNRGWLSKITKFWGTDGSFISARITLDWQVVRKVNNRTIRMVLNQKGTIIGVRIKRDFWREQICIPEKPSVNNQKVQTGLDFWNNHVDAKGTFKTKPLDHARTPSSSDWVLELWMHRKREQKRIHKFKLYDWYFVP